MMVKGGARPACASCKYQRRRCPADCMLAPYFPADHQRQFENCHRLFGVSNITKLLKKIDRLELRDAAMKSLIYEANMRQVDRVHGCVGTIYNLQLQMQHTLIELDAVNSQLTLLQQQQQLQFQSLQLAAAATEESSLVAAGNSTHYLLLDGRISITDSSSIGDNISGESVENQWANQTDLYNADSVGLNNPMAAMAAAKLQAPFVGINVGEVIDHDYDQISPYFDTIDEEGVFDPSSSESSLRDTMQSNMEQVAANELKQAAASFSLTSAVN